MKQSNSIYNPFIRTTDTTSRVMLDVIISLIPCIVMSYMAFGVSALSLIAVSVGSALIAEFLFSLVFCNRLDTLSDGSAVVTGILMAFTLGAFTPLYVVSFGAVMAVIFGKLLWGGIGRNLFNPALVGREFMTVFFPTVMTSGSIWYNADAVNHASLALSGNTLLDELIFKSSGALGEYSIACLTLGGLYLLLRRRITWHVPFTLLTVFIISIFVMKALGAENLSFSLGGLILGAVFMATDMPSSPSTASGKCYYGGMIGLTAALFILMGVKYEYMSYSILLLNGVVPFISRCFKPRIWGMPFNYSSVVLGAVVITVCVVIVTVLISLAASSKFNLILYLLDVYILYCIIRFVLANKNEGKLTK